MSDDANGTARGRDTRLMRAGREAARLHSVVNPPVVRASTVVFPTLAALRRAKGGFATEPRLPRYGLMGTATTYAFEDAMTALDGGAGCVVYPSGLSAIAAAIGAFVRPGDHILVVDAAYGPTRRFCSTHLSRVNVETEYYDPLIGAGVADLLRENTRLILLESPGSVTFEVQDAPAICAAARAAGVIAMLDATWATPLYFDAFGRGVDIALHAVTKYMGGHSDLLMGAASARTFALAQKLRVHAAETGLHVSAEDCYLALRGLRSMPARLARQSEAGLELARWLAARDEVAAVLHPALPGCPGHDLWRRDFTGAASLFSIVLGPGDETALAAMLDGMEVFSMGYSWGGYESLIAPYEPADLRTATTWRAEGPLLRLHVGLETMVDLKADLDAGLRRWAAAASG